MKLGVYGGTFNPIHRCHLAVALAARSARGLERVLLVPSARPPHKAGDLAPGEDRLAMARLGVQGHEGLEVSDMEIRRGGVSYTIDTLKELAVRYPDAELFFILGEDSVPELSGWKDVPAILERARIVTVNRPGSRADFRSLLSRGVAREAVERCERDRVTMTPCPVSSTAVRAACRAGEPLGDAVSPAVARYIEERGLYR